MRGEFHVVKEFSIKQSDGLWYVITRDPYSAYEVVPIGFEGRTFAELAARTLAAIWEAEGGVARMFEESGRKIKALA
jgi:hypothetical protein